ncbi:MAG TPA: hypothetical protein VN029_01975 [Sphingomonas sp.]|nr:hypothetical protein [Sphingomonas sp.]
MKSKVLIAAGLALACIGATDPSYRVGPTDNSTAPFNAHRDVTQEDCYFDPNHDAADLCAQWRAAKAAERSAESAASSNWIAYVSLIFSAIGMLGVGATIIYTRESLFEARKATKAAEDTLGEARLTGQAQARCYLAVTRAKVKIYKATGKPSADICIRNFGQTPAFKVKRSIRIGYSDRDDFGKARISEAMKSVSEGDLVAPGDEYQLVRIVYEFPLNDAEKELLTAGKLGVVLYVTVTGVDIFGKPFKVMAVFASISAKVDEYMELGFIGQDVVEPAL